MTADELSAEQEEHLVYGILREQGGIDPGRLGPVIDLAALGLVHVFRVAEHVRRGLACRGPDA